MLTSVLSCVYFFFTSSSSVVTFHKETKKKAKNIYVEEHICLTFSMLLLDFIMIVETSQTVNNLRVGTHQMMDICITNI